MSVSVSLSVSVSVCACVCDTVGANWRQVTLRGTILVLAMRLMRQVGRFGVIVWGTCGACVGIHPTSPQHANDVPTRAHSRARAHASRTTFHGGSLLMQCSSVPPSNVGLASLQRPPTNNPTNPPSHQPTDQPTIQPINQPPPTSYFLPPIQNTMWKHQPRHIAVHTYMHYRFITSTR